MIIDWFTVSAQVVNFLILVWLLKRFLYQPILNAIDARESKIAKELADADAQRTEARAERDTFQQKNTEFDQQRAALFSKVTDEAHAERQRLMEAARQDADGLRKKRQESLLREQQNLNGEINRRTREEVFALTRQTLTDLAGADLEQRLCVVFLQRLRELNGEARAALAKPLKTSSSPVLVRSAFDLSPQQQGDIQQAIHEAFSPEVAVNFETAPDLVSGIELTFNGRKIAWSISDYLTSLEQNVTELLQDHVTPAAKEKLSP